MGFEEQVGIWVAALFTLMMMSFAFKENKLSRIAEYVFVGAYTGNFLIIAVDNIRKVAITKIVAGNLIYIGVIFLGLLILFNIIPKYSWVAKYPTAFIVAFGLAVSMQTVVHAQFIALISATVSPFLKPMDPFTIFNNLLVVIGVITPLFYFIYTVEQKGPLRILATIGRYFMMVGFGAVYGGYVLSRMGWIFGRLSFLLHDWLALV